MARWKVWLPGTGPERKSGKAARYRLHASPGGEFAVIAVDYRQHGAVVELRRGRVTMKLDRGTYHVEQTAFPAAFIRLDGHLLLMPGCRDEHGSDCVMPLPLPGVASDTDHAA